MTQLVRKKIPDRNIIKSEGRTFSKRNLDESLSMEYDINLSHLTELRKNDFSRLLRIKEGQSKHILDLLYSIVPLPYKNDFING